MKHKHHLLPKHLGGTDDKNNLVEVSPTQHAMFHYCNWQLWKSDGDYIAWRALAGYSTKEEIIKQVLHMSGKRAGEIAKQRGQIQSIGHLQPRAVRRANGRRLIDFTHRNPRNTTQQTRDNRNFFKIFHVYESITERTIGQHLGDVIFNPEDITYNKVVNEICDLYHKEINICHLTKVANGSRMSHNGVFCSWFIDKPISSQATDASVEGSETTG